MESSHLDKQLKAYEKWKAGLLRTAADYRGWLKQHKLASPESENRIQECMAALDSDRLTIAFVAEFSRGKTELINAIFFADHGRRLLPSTAGRTTMCPTEMFYDNQADASYIRLLPIETRLEETSFEDLKRDKSLWVTYPIDPDNSAQVENYLREVVKTRRVTLEEAVRLGMYDPEHYLHKKSPPSHVEIPVWRHAQISFPHPLLKRGLNILDTPGMNALGSEPELTLNMLPSAQAVLFILAADAGVTRTDLEMWQNHIKGFHNNRKRGLMVVLNKIDTLWDDLKDEITINDTIEDQRNSTAKILGISRNAIFPVSAQKGLLAKVKQDPDLLDKSALRHLENYLSQDILNSRQEIIQDTITAEISQMLENTRGIVTHKLHGIKKQLEELRDLSGKSHNVIEHMMDRTRGEQAEYMRNVNSFQASRKVLKKQAVVLRDALDMKKLERTINETRRKMSGNWTTPGLKSSMRTLFDEMRNNMQVVVDQSEQSRKLIRSIYRRFQNDHGFTGIQPKMFSIMRYRVELELLYQEAEIFRKSPVTTMTEKHFVVKRFFIAMVSRARDIFFHARQEIDGWMKTALEPLAFQIQEHKNQMEHRLQDLKKVSHSRDTLESRIAELQEQYNAVAKQLTILRNMHNNLNNTRPMIEDERTLPRLISNRQVS